MLDLLLGRVVQMPSRPGARGRSQADPHSCGTARGLPGASPSGALGCHLVAAPTRPRSSPFQSALCATLRGSRGDTRSGAAIPALFPTLRRGNVAECAEREEPKSFLSSFPSFSLFEKGQKREALLEELPAHQLPASSGQLPRESASETTVATAPAPAPPATVSPPSAGDPAAVLTDSTVTTLPREASRHQSSIPVFYEQFSREWMGVASQDNFDGFRLEATKQVNKALTANHTFLLGTQSKEGGCSYSFGPTLVIGEPDEAAQQEGEMPAFFGMARLSSDGFLQTRFIKGISKTFDIKFNSNSSLNEDAKDKAMHEISFDKMGADWTANFKLAWQGTWILNGLFTQVITPKLQLGGELTWVTANGISMGSVGARYAVNDNNIVTCQIGVGPDFSSPVGYASDVYSGKAQYIRKVTDRLSIGTEFEYVHPDTSSALRVGWQYLFRQARVQGLVDTAGRVAMFAQDYNGFGLSGMIDYWHGDYKFGFQMNVVPPPPAQADQPLGV
ncbi:eukaryotic porin domain-containing [Cystoisospora suis]|uniref:Eukaryotic porin domain-containing n=1 Tax=Cystoisospora suis TaxID=483139 RepID=A0A2C6KRF1_9APIC|nr:eukaryotic porin domain-containing [Cystoisospora suis]